MTMIGALVQNGQGYILSDTLHADPATGRARGFAPKLIQGSKFPWCAGVTFCGHLAAYEELQRLDAPNVAELLERVPETLVAVRERSAELDYPNAAVRLVIVAWDEMMLEPGPRIFVAGDGLEEFAPSPWLPPGLTEVAFFFGADPVIAAEVAALWGTGTPNDPDRFDLHRDGLEAFEIVRRGVYTPLGGLPAGQYVGGKLLLSEIAVDGVLTGVIHDWGDEIANDQVEGAEAA